MAALCPGVQYGLSSQQNFGENKDLIFVKLTDSALRAIEEHIKNQNKFVYQSPTIKFLGNENGELSFPSTHHDSGCTTFSFSLSSTADMEGPAGSFECIQQIGTPRGSLECLGSIPYRMRIHANDDVYEVTRNRMTEAEDKYKNKCTREIKPNQTDIGRKVKVKQSRTPTVQSLRRDAPPSMRESLMKLPYQSNLPSKLHSATSTSSSSANNSSSNNINNGLGSNLVSSSRPQLNNKPSVPDIAKRPLKERLIHLLALRPFKKVELYERLTKEGLRERNGMSSMLKQISKMKDNCYYLNRSMWNEVHEDWPFYTESEKQILKRRKPQNLTPPGSSDGGSSGSGQSPTSTHPGSPPQITSTKRPGFYDGADGIPTKRQRVSHYKKPADQMYHHRSPIIENNNSQRRPVTDSRDASNMNPRSRESPTSGYFNSSMMNGFSNNTTVTTNNHITNSPQLGGVASNISNNTTTPSLMLNEKRSLNLSDDDDDDDDDDKNANNLSSVATTINTNNNKKRSCDNNHSSLSFGVNREKTFVSSNCSGGSRGVSPAKSLLMEADDARKENIATSAAPNNMVVNGFGGLAAGTTATTNGGHKERSNSKYSKVTSSTQSNRIARVSPDSQTDNIPPPADLEPAPPPSKTIKPDSNAEFPDYLTQYVTIKNQEQRRRYKADFNADYTEYRHLHGIVEKVSRRFAQLEERLKNESETSPKYKDLMKQIVKEYQENKKDLEHQRTKRRFQHLHEKLSHIKRLVLEYDYSRNNSHPEFHH